jgi:hypothetical protein
MRSSERLWKVSRDKDGAYVEAGSAEQDAAAPDKARADTVTGGTTLNSSIIRTLDKARRGQNLEEKRPNPRTIRTALTSKRAVRDEQPPEYLANPSLK